jgi:hypothetical protein
MKKNKIMRLASGLLVAVLLTTCAISGTFAKYVTNGTATDSARVAKWGVTVNSIASDANLAFKKTYADTTAGVTVEASVDVVAPGTNGTMTGFTVSGTPEVDVTVNYTNVDVELGNNWIDKFDIDKFYCPIAITVSNNAGTVTLCGLNFATADAFELAVEALIVGAAGYYEAGTDLSTVDNDLTISWNWAFEGATGTENDQDNEKDTFLGDRAAQDAANAGTIAINVTCLIEQVD